jgi:heat shock protein HslJ
MDWWRVNELLGKKLPNWSKSGDIELGLRLDAADDTVYVFGGCNDFGGTFKGSESTLRFEGLVSGRRLCEQKVTETENTFLGALLSVNSYKLVGDELDLYDIRGTMLVRLRAGTLVPKRMPV